MATSKSPKAVLALAYEMAKQALPRYSCPHSPHTFTQAQLLACLVLKEFLHQDYRGFTTLLAENPHWRRLIGLSHTPHYTTLQKAEARLMKNYHFEALLNAIIKRAIAAGILGKKVELCAMDGSGLEARQASRYYARKKEHAKAIKDHREASAETFKRYPFYVSMCDCRSHLVLSAWVGEGPTYEIKRLPWLLKQGQRRVPLKTLLADAAYDSEKVHVLSREKLKIHTIIPPINGRNKTVTTPPRGKYRRQLWRRFDRTSYGQRAQAETVNSMLKRNLGSALRARSQQAHRQELRLRLFTLNVMIV